MTSWQQNVNHVEEEMARLGVAHWWHKNRQTDRFPGCRLPGLSGKSAATNLPISAEVAAKLTQAPALQLRPPLVSAPRTC